MTTANLKWNSHGYQVELTGDGSPTLRVLSSQTGATESMHHSGGAAAETDYIYGKTTDLILAKNLQPKVVVVGLGLGYIEALIVDRCLKHGSLHNLRMQSFEKDRFLTQSLQKYLQDNLEQAFAETYDLAFAKLLNGSQIKAVKAAMLKLLKTKQWQIDDELKQPFSSNEKFNILQYDAFSSKTDQHLWEESFLVDFIENFAEKSCAFATYACMGNLKRALKSTGFELEIRPGFQGKRNSSFAIRNF